MKRTLSIMALLAVAASYAQAATLSQRVDEWVANTKKALVVYDNKNTFVQKVRFSWLEQFQVADVQPNGSNGLHLKKPASPVNQEFRRSWLGVTVDMASSTTFRTWFRVGGLPERESYSTRTKRNFSYSDLFEIWVKQNITPVKGLSVQAGKIKSLFSTDYITSSSAIYCTERSLISQQFAQDSNWGVEIAYAPTKSTKFFAQLMANDRALATKNINHGDVYRDGRGFKGEFGWEDKCYSILGASHRFAQTATSYQEVSAQFMHDYNNAYHGRRKPGNNNFGLGFKDAISLGYEAKFGRLLLIGNVISAFEQQSGHGTNNIGVQFQPVYSITPHVDLVFRYVGMTGHGACKLGADRYITYQTEAPLWVDSIHSFYVGVDLYASAKEKNAAKLMIGAEYTTARAGGSDCYNGWEYTTAVRWNF